MKNIGVIIFTVLIAFAATSYAVSRTWGRVGPKDKIIFSQRFFNYTYLYGVSRNVQFPEYKKTNNVKITVIQAIDNNYSQNRTNSFPTLLAGGVGYTYFTMNLKAGPGGNLDYQVRVYGRK